MTKISDLPALAAVDLDATADIIPIVDMSEAPGARNKQIAVSELASALGAGDMLAANNLSDLGDVSDARDNLDVYSKGEVDGAIASAGGGGGVTSLDGLTDVDTTTTAPTEGDVLTYVGGEWVPEAPAGSAPAFEGCKIYPTANFTPTTGALTNLTVTQSEKFDTGGFHSSANYGRITFGFAGYVELFAQLVRTANVTGAIALMIRLYNSGGGLLGTLCRQESDTGGGDQVNCTTGPIHVSNGDYAYLTYFIDSAGDCDGGDYATWFSMKVLDRD